MAHPVGELGPLSREQIKAIARRLDEALSERWLPVGDAPTTARDECATNRGKGHVRAAEHQAVVTHLTKDTRARQWLSPLRFFCLTFFS